MSCGPTCEVAGAEGREEVRARCEACGWTSNAPLPASVLGRPLARRYAAGAARQWLEAEHARYAAAVAVAEAEAIVRGGAA